MKRISREQFELMVDYMERNGDLCLSPIPGVKGTWCNHDKWQELTDLLNSIEGSVCKTPDKWRSTWVDIKSVTRRKMFKLNKGILKTKITDLEKRIYDLIPNKVPCRTVYMLSAEEAKEIYPENSSYIKHASVREIEETQKTKSTSCNSTHSNSQPEKRKCSEDGDGIHLKIRKTVDNKVIGEILDVGFEKEIAVNPEKKLDVEFENEIAVNEEKIIVIEVKPEPSTKTSPEHKCGSDDSEPDETDLISSAHRSSSVFSDAPEDQGNNYKNLIKKYFKNEREKEKNLHVREMAQIKQHQCLVSMFGRIGKAVETLAPNILKYFERV